MQNNSLKNLEQDLAGFIGTQNYYRHSIGNFSYTDGVKYLADTANCYWLLDVIGSHILKPRIRKILFQVWELTVNENRNAVITMREDTNLPAVVEQKIPFTDFPLKKIKLYFIDDVLMLPSEY